MPSTLSQAGAILTIANFILVYVRASDLAALKSPHPDAKARNLIVKANKVVLAVPELKLPSIAFGYGAAVVRQRFVNVAQRRLEYVAIHMSDDLRRA
jgi:hypothetical protein